jgi:hypothetical protein
MGLLGIRKNATFQNLDQFLSFAEGVEENSSFWYIVYNVQKPSIRFNAWDLKFRVKI